MNQDQHLQHLFDLARTEPVETSASDVHKWMGMTLFMSVLTHLLSSLKISFTKSVIMYTSIISVIGIGTTALILSQSKTSIPEEKVTVSDTPAVFSMNETLDAPETETVASIGLSSDMPSEQVDKNVFVLSELTEEASMIPELPVETPAPIEKTVVLQNELPEKKQTISISGTENTLPAFNKISTGGVFKLVLIQGDSHSYKTTGNYTADDFKVTVDEKTKELHISYCHQEKTVKKKGKNTVINTTNDGDLTLYLTFKSLEKLSVNGIVKVTAQTDIVSEELKLNIGGISLMELPVKATTLDVQATGATKSNLSLTVQSLNLTISGTSTVHFTGSTNNLDATFSGSSHGKFNDKLQLEKALISLSGTSNLELSATTTESVKLNLSGASKLNLSGATKQADIYLSGTSAVKAEKFSTNDVKAQTDGASSLAITVNEKAHLRASGTSQMKISGKPSNYDASTTGAATIKKTEGE